MTTPPRTIELNCDIGESDAAEQVAADAALLQVISSANIACGGHAGDNTSMTRTIRLAINRGVAIGAHPSYPDRAGFGRTDMTMSAADVEACVKSQLAALDRVATSLGARIAHIKPHGALYHAAMTKPDVARAIARAAACLATRPTLVGLAGSAALALWQSMGFTIAAEAFADRRYEPDGSLRSRTHTDSLITSAAHAAQQAVRIAQGSGPRATNGAPVPLHATTICIHSDTPGAPTLASAVRVALEHAGFAIAQPPAAGAHRS